LYVRISGSQAQSSNPKEISNPEEARVLVLLKQDRPIHRAKIRAMSSASAQMTENLARVRERIELSATRAGRQPEEITLIAVSKTHSARKIQELYEAGVRHFAENRVQERESKLAHLTGLGATWHMIGHIQKNKAAKAVRMFDSVDSVDSIALAEKLNRAKEEFNTEISDRAKIHTDSVPSAYGNQLRVLIEVKLDPAPAKSGVDGRELPRLLEALTLLPLLNLHGLMGVPPYFDDPEEARPYFRRLRELRDAVRAQLGSEMLPVLSIGMSHDLEIAIEEGATEVRVGTALFGERERA
jgi:pyridoxal phosphate enzyme (YggS family)